MHLICVLQFILLVHDTNTPRLRTENTGDLQLVCVVSTVAFQKGDPCCGVMIQHGDTTAAFLIRQIKGKYPALLEPIEIRTGIWKASAFSTDETPSTATLCTSKTPSKSRGF